MPITKSETRSATILKLSHAGRGIADIELKTAKCPHFELCGGCSLQHMQHALQLELKQQTMLEQLQLVGKTTPETLLEPISDSLWQYRHKARLGVKFVFKKNKLLIGFHEKNGRYLADLECCPILANNFGAQIPKLRELINSLSIYQHIPQLEFAHGNNKTALVIRHLKDFSSKDLIKLKAFAAEHSFNLYLQPNKVKFGKLFWPENSSELLSYLLTEYDLELFFHPQDFVQINYAVNKKMLQQAIKLLDPQPDDTILDLFCGLGNFTLSFAKKVQKITGVEGDEHMVTRAKINAEHNQIINTEFFAHDLTKNLSAQSWAQQPYNKIILDPPRCGAKELILQLQQFNADKILYISCNPSTLARDVGELTQLGYRLTQIGIIDMFPHTKHIETMALLQHN